MLNDLCVNSVIGEVGAICWLVNEILLGATKCMVGVVVVVRISVHLSTSPIRMNSPVSGCGQRWLQSQALTKDSVEANTRDENDEQLRLSSDKDTKKKTFFFYCHSRSFIAI